MKTPTLEQVIREHIQLSPRPNGRGFFSVLCKVCNDHGKKGKRAGFRFDGDLVGYNCFNCGHGALFDPVENETMPNNMAAVLDRFGIPKVDWQAVLFTALANKQAGTAQDKRAQYASIEPDQIELPSFFYRLTDDGQDEIAQYAIEYLRDQRSIDYQNYPFYLSRAIDHPDSSKWFGRLIIPTYKDNKLVFWQGRDLSGIHVKKYLSVNVPRDNILYGYDQVAKYSEEPLYIVEGWFDAFHLDGVAVYGNKMTAAQIKWINRSHRQKVVIPDKFGSGYLLARQAIELGWSVSYPDIGSCKDIDEAVNKYGKLYTLMTIKEHTCTGFAAESQLGVYCEYEPPESKNTNKKSSKANR